MKRYAELAKATLQQVKRLKEEILKASNEISKVDKKYHNELQRIIQFSLKDVKYITDQIEESSGEIDKFIENITNRDKNNFKTAITVIENDLTTFYNKVKRYK